MSSHFISIWFSFSFFFVFYNVSEFSNISGYYCKYCLSVMEIFLSSVLFFHFVSGACLFFYYIRPLYVYFECAGSVVAALYRFSFSSGAVVAGTVRLK